jgi:tetratricopeptide (TPR) repeat protein
LRVELGQDPFITTIIPNDVSDDLREAGHEDGFDVPLALQREIAREHHMGYFVFPTIQSVSDAGVTVQVQLHETKTGRSIFAKTFSEPSLPALIDRVSVAIRRELGLPDAHINDLPDLPVAERVTASAEALHHWAYARHEIAFGTASQADAQARQAIAADSTFTLAYLARFITLRQLGKERERYEALKNVRTYKYRLTESQEYWTRTYDLIFDRKPEQAFDVAQRWHELYPENRQALTLLLVMHDRRGNYEKAADILKKVIDLSPTPGNAQIRLGTLYEKSGHYDKALEAYETYIDAYPYTSLGHRSVAGVHIQEGRLSDALDVLLRGESITPDDASLRLFLSRVYGRLNQMSDAEAYLSAAKHAASSPRTKADVYSAEIDFFERLGRIDEALAVHDDFWDGALLSDAQRARSYGDAASLYVRDGQPERAEDLIERMAHNQNAAEGGTPSRLRYLSASAELALARRDTTAADSVARKFIDLARQVETETGYKEMAIRSYFSGRTALLAQRSQEAIDAFSRYQHLTRGHPWLDAGKLLARAHHQSGDLDRAQDSFENALARDRGDARLRLHYARLLRDREAYEAAIAHLDTALTIWSGADPSYRYPHEARALRDTLSPLLASTSQNP